MSDRFYTVLAFIGFIILCVIYVFNVNPERYTNTFNVGDYYAPNSVNSAQNAAEIYQDLSGGRRVTCPQIELKMSDNDISYLSGIYLSTEVNKYNNICFFINFNDLGVDNTVVTKSGFIDELNLIDSAVNNKKGVLIGNLIKDFSESTTPNMEIVAPFKFIFNNINTTDLNNKIEIINSSGNCMITFENVVNWFCAGGPGTESENNENTDIIPEDWNNHQHNSIIGNSANAVVTGGQAGQVIGYANASTKVTIYCRDTASSSWEEISIKDWLNSGS